mmetsp:Transcript_10351/g.21479  ORF Transcript_10351/g.21479 Transcript_10351/m.21479 type:complete len:789 (+) Transcript_10351:102-2468(+)
MCGIGFILSLLDSVSDGAPSSPTTDDSATNYEVGVLNDLNHHLSEALAPRGPDIPRRQFNFSENSSNNKGWSLTIHASVLHMRGEVAVEQPVLFSLDGAFHDQNYCGDGDDGDLTCALCWNGECYTYKKEDAIDGNMVELISDNDQCQPFISEHANISDTTLIKQLIFSAISVARTEIFHDKNEIQRVAKEHDAIARALSRVHGEFSFIIFIPSKSSDGKASGSFRGGHIYYGRDSLGRRSLLVNKSLRGIVAISSVAVETKSSENLKMQTYCDNIESSNSFNMNWEEIPAGIVYRMDVLSGVTASIRLPKIVNAEVDRLLSEFVESSCLDTSIFDLSDEVTKQSNSERAACVLLELLDRAVRRRVAQAPIPSSNATKGASVAVLFSGGIDSVVLAALSNTHVPKNQPIDLINVSFHVGSSGVRSGPQSPDRLAAKLSYLEMKRRWPERDWRFIAVDVPYEEVLKNEKHILRIISPLDSTMDFNIATAFWFAGLGQGRIMGRGEIEETVPSHSNKSVMKGGLDEPLLRFANKNGESKQAFCKKSNVQRQCVRMGCTRSAPPDGCIFGACRFCCGKLQGPISSFLGKAARLCPEHNDNNTGAARKIRLRSEVTQERSGAMSSESYTAISFDIRSRAKILLSGVGADEQMAGYGRHRSTFERSGYPALQSELRMEIKRLWTRNLGRDDRCLSDHGKETRFPFLDEDVVTFLEKIPLELKCDMSLPAGEGDKLILRRVARMIGVNECSSLVKRAIQFGSRIARVSDKSRFGSQRQATGQAKHRTLISSGND